MTEEFIPLTPEHLVLQEIQNAVIALPTAQRKECTQLAEHFRAAIRRAGDPVGRLALALVGAEFAAE